MLLINDFFSVELHMQEQKVWLEHPVQNFLKEICHLDKEVLWALLRSGSNSVIADRNFRLIKNYSDYELRFLLLFKLNIKALFVLLLSFNIRCKPPLKIIRLNIRWLWASSRSKHKKMSSLLHNYKIKCDLIHLLKLILLCPGSL